MNRNTLAFILLMFTTIILRPDELFCQIEISPELGVSYLPFSITSSINGREIYSKSFDPVLGVSGEVSFSRKWAFSSSVSFTKRKNMNWRGGCGFAYCYLDRYTHSDINIDFHVNYYIKEYVSLGLGPSIIQKINSNISTESDSPSYDIKLEYPQNHRMFGLNLGTTINFWILNLKLEYTRMFFKEEDVFEEIWHYNNGKNRFNMMLAYPIKSKQNL